MTDNSQTAESSQSKSRESSQSESKRFT